MRFNYEVHKWLDYLSSIIIIIIIIIFIVTIVNQRFMQMMLHKLVMSVYRLDKTRWKRPVATLLVPACIPQISNLRTDRPSCSETKWQTNEWIAGGESQLFI